MLACKLQLQTRRNLQLYKTNPHFYDVAYPVVVDVSWADDA